MNYFTSTFLCRCPHCRQENLFHHSNPYDLSKKILDMKANCTTCGQRTELETGFWWGTGYISYGLAVIISFINVLWFSPIFGWETIYSVWGFLLANALVLMISMPWLVRFSRVFYLSFFVRYDDSFSKKSK
jgi:hypothetical protein